MDSADFQPGKNAEKLIIILLFLLAGIKVPK
jgi:hypothetical protein